MRKELIGSTVLFGCLTLALADDAKQTLPPKTTNAPLAAVAAPQNEESYSVIGYLEKRDRVITIKSSPHGTIYSVATKDGKILHENLSAEQLKAQAPELYDIIKTGTAGDARVHPIILDSTMR